jgi:hypothetical protein
MGKIVWAHPAIGKTHLRENSNLPILDFDSDFKPLINSRNGLEPGHAARVKWRKHHSFKWDDEIRNLWLIAKEEARNQNRTLLVSDIIILKEFEDDLDAVITMPRILFFARVILRNDWTKDTKHWKKSIDAAIALVKNPTKVSSRSEYMEDLIHEFLPD